MAAWTGVIRQDPLGLEQIYVQAKRYAAAHTVGRPLAVLAHEEFGKSWMAVALAAADPNVLRPTLLRELTGGHIRKLMSTYEHEAMVGPPERTAEVLGSQGLARNANERKQRGFYVDFADDGSLRLPSEVGASRCQTGRPGNGHAFRRAGGLGVRAAAIVARCRAGRRSRLYPPGRHGHGSIIPGRRAPRTVCGRYSIVSLHTFTRLRSGDHLARGRVIAAGQTGG